MSDKVFSNSSLNFTKQFVRGNVVNSGNYGIYGTLIFTSNAVNTTMTLPDPTTGSVVFKDCYFNYHCGNSSNALDTFNNTTAGGTIQGQSSVTFGAGDSCVFYTDGASSNYFIHNLVLQPADFRAYRSTNTTLPASPTALTVLFDTEVRDIGAFYAPGTGIWTPLLPGVGPVGGQVTVDFDGSENTTITCQLQKNGSSICTSTQYGVMGTAREIYFPLTPGLQELNGSTDNWKVVISQTGANTQTILGTLDKTFFWGMRTGLF